MSSTADKRCPDVPLCSLACTARAGCRVSLLSEDHQIGPSNQKPGWRFLVEVDAPGRVWKAVYNRKLCMTVQRSLRSHVNIGQDSISLKGHYSSFGFESATSKWPKILAQWIRAWPGCDSVFCNLPFQMSVCVCVISTLSWSCVEHLHTSHTKSFMCTLSQ